MKSIVLLIALLVGPITAMAESVLETYPILTIPRSDNSDVLLRYKLTAREKTLFKEIDSETAKLSPTAELSEYHDVAIRVSRKYGLSTDQSVAFFTRTTFSEFEQ
ncbi:hypothetical protein [Cupriavidus necator]|jgi:hypothetical protein|uniref:hypothetical protein n=1 Tax=Cupriavidus necator TaxID=106590 RepID=UPI0011D18920|nr:hypothetical protein [Cupriavidus necator]MDX6007969.1 hypothetical protein [Cupriavidus necator]